MTGTLTKRLKYYKISTETCVCNLVKKKIANRAKVIAHNSPMS